MSIFGGKEENGRCISIRDIVICQITVIVLLFYTPNIIYNLVDFINV